MLNDDQMAEIERIRSSLERILVTALCEPYVAAGRNRTTVNLRQPRDCRCRCEQAETLLRAIHPEGSGGG